MKTALRSTALFTSVTAALLAGADLLVAFVYQGTPTEQLVPHGLFLVAVVLLSGAGAFAAFAALRHRSPSRGAVVVSALLFGVASFFAVVWLFSLGGLTASAAWLLFGAAVFAAGSTLLGSRHAG
jgi:hypothetical protein